MFVLLRFPFGNEMCAMEMIINVAYMNLVFVDKK